MTIFVNFGKILNNGFKRLDIFIENLITLKKSLKYTISVSDLICYSGELNFWPAGRNLHFKSQIILLDFYARWFWKFYLLNPTYLIVYYFRNSSIRGHGGFIKIFIMDASKVAQLVDPGVYVIFNAMVQNLSKIKIIKRKFCNYQYQK